MRLVRSSTEHTAGGGGGGGGGGASVHKYQKKGSEASAATTTAPATATATAAPAPPAPLLAAERPSTKFLLPAATQSKEKEPSGSPAFAPVALVEAAVNHPHAPQHTAAGDSKQASGSGIGARRSKRAVFFDFFFRTLPLRSLPLPPLFFFCLRLMSSFDVSCVPCVRVKVIGLRWTLRLSWCSLTFDLKRLSCLE